MNNILYTSGLLIVLFTLLFSCSKEVETDNMLNSVSKKFNDYMPLKVGAKYEYKFKESFTIGSALRLTETVCLWEFISVSADSTIWKVKETMNGYRVHIRDYGTPLQTKDTALIKDSVTIGTWVYSIHSDRRVLTHTYDWFPRFLQSEAADTCIRAYELCLKKNAGILHSFQINWSNYDGREYDLIKGPYF